MEFNRKSMAAMLLLSQSQFWQEQGIYEHQAQGDGAYPVEERGAVVATCMTYVQLAEEIYMTGILKPIHKAAKENRTKDNRTEI